MANKAGVIILYYILNCTHSCSETEYMLLFELLHKNIDNHIFTTIWKFRIAQWNYADAISIADLTRNVINFQSKLDVKQFPSRFAENGA